MKKILSALTGTLFILNCFAQPIMQASIGAGSTSRSVKIYIKTSAPIGANLQISTLQFDVAIPSTFTPVPTVTFTANTAFLTSVPWTISPPVIEDGYLHYIVENSGTPIYSKLDGSETDVLELTFAGSGTTTFSLVTLPDGGAGATNGRGLYLCTSSTVNSIGNNLYYARLGTTVFNGDSYRPSGNSGTQNGLGTQISYATLGAPIVLPVKFTSFSATKKDNDALLSWVVENETSLVTNYEVERSTDGIKFDKINTIAKNGGTSNIYNITDPNLSALVNNGIIYYRIKQIDLNGEFVYSDIKNVRLSEKATLISAFPNPVTDYTTVKIDVIEAAEVTVSLISADGKQLQTSTLKAAKGLNLKKVDMNNLPKGDYLLKVMSGTEVQTIKVVKL
jgi:Secretion system C-terminal sorting domain